LLFKGDLERGPTTRDTLGYSKLYNFVRVALPNSNSERKANSLGKAYSLLDLAEGAWPDLPVVVPPHGGIRSPAPH